VSVFLTRSRYVSSIACLSALCGCLSFLEAPAAEWSIIDSYTSTVDYNSNRRLTSDGKADGAAILSADVVFKRALEDLELTLEPHYVWRRYTDPVVGNGDDREITAGMRWNSSETSQLTLNASYWDQSTLSTEVLETGVISGQIHRRSTQANGNWTYGLTEMRSIVASVNWQDISYYGPSSDLLTSYRYPSGSVGERFTLNERGSLTVSGFGSSLQSDTQGNSSHEYGLQAELAYQLSELSNVDLSLGESARVLAGKSSRGTDGSVAYVRTLEMGRINVSYSRSLVPYATGFLVEREQYQAALSHAWSSSLESSLSFFRIKNNKNTVLLRLDRREYNSLAASLTWRPTERTWSIGGTLEGIRTQTPDLLGERIYGWRCSVGITWSPLAKSISR
jgi:hypothetical protein